MLFPPVKESCHFRLRLKFLQRCPKGWHLESCFRVAGVQYIHIPPLLLHTISVGQGIGTHCLERLRLAAEVQETGSKEVEWRSSTAGEEGKSRIISQHNLQLPSQLPAAQADTSQLCWDGYHYECQHDGVSV